MKAIAFTKYGSPEDLLYGEVEKPVPKENELLIRVYAASINSWDWELLQGKPFANRMMFGLFAPKKIESLGCDIAGRVEAVGEKVTRFKPGDDVFGDLSGGDWGGFAEYTCANEDVLVSKPADMTFEQAAAIPQAGVLALQGLRKGNLQTGQKILINGASGGAGSFAVQMAKATGAEITGVCRTAKLDFVRSLGVDHVIDYTREDFTRNGQQYDLILDMMARHRISDYRRALAPKGAYVAVGGASFLMTRVILLGPLINLFSDRKIGLLLHKPAAHDLEQIKSLFESGKVIPVIDKCFPLSEGIEAMRYFSEGRAKGKVVITVDQDV